MDMVIGKMNMFFNKPYPFYFSAKRNFILACIVGVGIALFNMIFSEELLYIQYFSYSKLSVSVFFGLITFCSVQLVLFEKWYKKKHQEKWSIKNELKALFVLHVFVGALNYALLLLLTNNFSDFYSVAFLLSVLFSTIIIGMFPTFLIVWADYTIKLKNNLKEVEKINLQLKEGLLRKQALEVDNLEVLLMANKTNELRIILKDLLFVKSDGNYVDVYINEGTRIVKKVVRISIGKMEKELSEFKNIVKTHRSYLVNIENVRFTQGNARNYQLLFYNTDLVVPVSRSQFNVFNTALEKYLPTRNK